MDKIRLFKEIYKLLRESGGEGIASDKVAAFAQELIQAFEANENEIDSHEDLDTRERNFLDVDAAMERDRGWWVFNFEDFRNPGIWWEDSGQKLSPRTAKRLLRLGATTDLVSSSEPRGAESKEKNDEATQTQSTALQDSTEVKIQDQQGVKSTHLQSNESELKD